MGIVMTTSMNDIDQYMDEQIERRIKEVVEAFKTVGEKCFEEARTNKTYKNDTGNLRSSVGYAVMRDGVAVIKGGFGLTLKGEKGIETGNYELERLMARPFLDEGVVLIVVAGMNYAAAVEAKNFNVLASAELLCEQLVPQLMKQLGFTTTK